MVVMKSCRMLAYVGCQRAGDLQLCVCAGPPHGDRQAGPAMGLAAITTLEDSDVTTDAHPGGGTGRRPAGAGTCPGWSRGDRELRHREPDPPADGADPRLATASPLSQRPPRALR